MKFFSSLIIFVIVLHSCKTEVEENLTNNGLQDSIAFKGDSINFEDDVFTGMSIQVTLQEEPKNIVRTWLAYITAQDEMNNLANASLETVLNKASSYAKILDELRTTVPDEVNANAVNARIKVLYTKSKILEQLTKRQTVDEAKVLELAAELPQDFENFKLQLNELFLKTPDEFEIELDDRLDSIQKANEERLERENAPIQFNPDTN